jgi:DNA-binding transcriptional LysR family regulator
LRAFEAVGRLGGIRRAAKELEIDHAVVSRHIRSLESWLGLPLLVRNGGSYELTEPGGTYHREIAAALAAIATATGRMVEVQEDQRLSIWCIPGFASLWLSDRLGDFIRAHPQISVDLRPSDHSPDFRAREVDCDIRYLRRWEESGVSRVAHGHEFARPEVFPVCSPELLATLPPINDAASLLACPLLHEDSDAEWTGWFEGQNVKLDGRLPGTRLWHAHLTIGAARQGRGVALANPMLLGTDLADGALVAIRPRLGAFAPVSFGGYTLFARDDRWNARPVLAFRRWLARAVAADSAKIPMSEAAA